MQAFEPRWPAAEMTGSGTATAKIVPVVIAGGAGTRLWPMSRSLYPKQFLQLIGSRSLLAATCRRVADPTRFSAPLILCNEDHRFIVAEQLREADVVPQAVLLEPVGCGTAAAVTTAALYIAQSDPQGLMLVLAADGHIERPEVFLAAVATGTLAAKAGALVTFGVTPSRPETGYGYLQIGAPLADVAGVHRVDTFLEKPDRATAEAFAASGRHLWNSGNFLFRADAMLGEVERLQPGLLGACRVVLARAQPHHEHLLLDRAALVEIAISSIDQAIMEHTDRAAVVPVDMGWSDVGSWDALWDVGSKDAEGNVVVGDVLLQDAHGSYVRGNGRMVAAVGIEDLVIVETDDVVFVAPRARAAEAKGLVERLKQADRPEAASHTSVYRPWGSYRSVDRGDRFQVKRIIVKPGGRLSAQWHHHRAEHWVIVQGTAKVTVGEETRLLHENESIYVPAGTVHRLENPGRLPLYLIEVQTGSYLGEDDIVRLDDDYGRR